MMTIQGLDVSNWQGRIDWRQVPDPYVWAYAKASEDTTFADPDFLDNWRGMGQSGLVRGVYHFFRPDTSHTPEAQAQFFLDQLDLGGGLTTGDFLVLDAEVSAAGVPLGLHFAAGSAVRHAIALGEYQPYVRAALKAHGPAVFLRELAAKSAAADETLAKTLAWLAYVENAVGFKPLLYSGAWFLQPHNMLNNATLSQHGLILAAYQTTLPPVPAGWNFLAGWQYSDSGSVDGISAPVDLDLFNGTTAQLRAYGKPASPVPAPLVWDETARLAFIEAVAAGVDVAMLQQTLAGYQP